MGDDHFFRPDHEQRFHVAVWDHEGNVVKTHWDATPDEVDEIMAEYECDPMHTVVVKENW